MVWTKLLWKTTLASALAGAFLLLGGATTTRADDFDACRRNVHKWEDRLERDINRHGASSRQANHDRHELAEARQNCDHRYGRYSRDHDDYDHDGDGR